MSHNARAWLSTCPGPAITRACQRTCGACSLSLRRLPQHDKPQEKKEEEEEDQEIQWKAMERTRSAQRVEQLEAVQVRAPEQAQQASEDLSEPTARESGARKKVIVLSCPEFGTLDPYNGPPYDQPVMDKIEEMQKAGKVKFGFDRAGTSTKHPDDKDLDWRDPEEIRHSAWMYGFKTAAKALIKIESQNFSGVLVIVCINGGMITTVEGEEMGKVVNDAKSDAAKSNVKVRARPLCARLFSPALSQRCCCWIPGAAGAADDGLLRLSAGVRRFGSAGPSRARSCGRRGGIQGKEERGCGKSFGLLSLC
eukprot:COSAG04_NODE_3892_length_2444_cov_4.701493_2_plen_309_part_00